MENQEQELLKKETAPETMIEERERAGGYKVREIVYPSDQKYPEYLGIRDIEYETPDGKVFSIKQLLPKGWRLFRISRDEKAVSAEAKHVYYGDRHRFYKSYIAPKGEIPPQEVEQEALRRFVDPKSRRVTEYISLKQIECKGFFLELLHELGHAYIYEIIKEEGCKKDLDALAIINQKRRLGFVLSPQELALHQQFITVERDAWAWALRELRKLRHAGIDLEPELQSPKKIFSAIRGALKTHSWEDLTEKEFNEAWRAGRYIEDKSIKSPF